MSYEIKPKENEKYTLAQWCLIDNMRKGKSIEIPSLNIRINPDGSTSKLEDKTK